MNKNFVTKMVASIGLLAIFISVVGTGLIIMFSADQTQAPSELTQEELNRILQFYNSGETSQTGGSQSGEILDLSQSGTLENTGITNE